MVNAFSETLYCLTDFTAYWVTTVSRHLEDGNESRTPAYCQHIIYWVWSF